MNNDASSRDHSVPVPPRDLIPFYSSLGTVLIESNITGVLLNEIMTRHVCAECVLCGLKFDGDELSLMATSDLDQDSGNPKLARLRLGYCGRADCQSRNYTVNLLSHPALDWREIAAQANQTQSALKQPFRSQSQIDSFERANRPAVPVVSFKLLMVLGIILGTILAHLWLNGLRIPLLQPKHTYSINPSSVRTNN